MSLVEVTQADIAAMREASHSLPENLLPHEAQALAEHFARHRADTLTEALRVVREARSCMLDLPAQSYADKAIKHNVLDKIDAFIAQHEGEAKPDACHCGRPTTTTYDGEAMCEGCATYCARRDFEESEMPGGFGG